MLEEKRENPFAEPQEVVSWYTPCPKEGKEVVCYYVHPNDLPAKARPAEWNRPTKRHGRRGLWIFLTCMSVLIAALMITLAVLNSRDQGDKHTEHGGAEGDASNIVDIFLDVGINIPKVAGDSNVRLEVHPSRGEELSPQQVYAAVNPSVVTVVANKEKSSSIGTGVIMTSDGYIITNAHVLYDTDSCWIATYNGVTFDAMLVGYDALQDLAVLKAVAATGLPAAQFGDSGEAMVGDTVYAIGNPLGLELRGTFTDGIISAVNRDVEMDGRILTLLQTNAALNNGNSGGPLINRYGQIIGINVMKMSGTGGDAAVEGLGFALPISDMSFVVNDIVAHGCFRGTPTLGIMVQTVIFSDGSTAVVVHSVTSDSAAAEAGVQPGDVILAADGISLSQTNDLLTVRRNHSVGDVLRLTIRRGEEVLEVELTLRSDRS